MIQTCDSGENSGKYNGGLDAINEAVRCTSAAKKISRCTSGEANLPGEANLRLVYFRCTSGEANLPGSMKVRAPCDLPLPAKLRTRVCPIGRTVTRVVTSPYGKMETPNGGQVITGLSYLKSRNPIHLGVSLFYNLGGFRQVPYRGLREAGSFRR